MPLVNFAACKPRNACKSQRWTGKRRSAQTAPVLQCAGIAAPGARCSRTRGEPRGWAGLAWEDAWLSAASYGLDCSFLAVMLTRADSQAYDCIRVDMPVIETPSQPLGPLLTRRSCVWRAPRRRVVSGFARAQEEMLAAGVRATADLEMGWAGVCAGPRGSHPPCGWGRAPGQAPSRAAQACPWAALLLSERECIALHTVCKYVAHKRAWKGMRPTSPRSIHPMIGFVSYNVLTILYSLHSYPPRSSPTSTPRAPPRSTWAPCTAGSAAAGWGCWRGAPTNWRRVRRGRGRV